MALSMTLCMLHHRGGLEGAGVRGGIKDEGGVDVVTCLIVLQGLRGSIPATFPYFHVEFNLTKGFVHVIDDETKFDPQFGRSIMIGLLDLPAEDMHRCAAISVFLHYDQDFNVL